MAVIRVDAFRVTHPRTTQWAALTLARSALRLLAQQAQNEADRELAIETLERIALVLGERAQGGGRI